MRFLKQRNSYSCGVIALLNAERIRGKKITYSKDYKIYRDLLNCTEDSGTRWEQFNRLCHVLGFKYSETYKGQAPLIIQQCSFTGSCHYCVILKYSKDLQVAYVLNTENFKHEWVDSLRLNVHRAWQI